MHSQSQVQSTALSNLVVTDLEGKNPIELPHTYTREKIPADYEQIPTRKLFSQWEHLSEIAQNIPQFQPGLEIGLLIGTNCPVALEPLQVVPSQENGPFALRLRHGWTSEWSLEN